MTPNPVAFDVASSCQGVAALMRDKGVGSVVVLEGGKVAGIVTDRQLCCDVLTGQFPTDAPIGEVMTPTPGRLHMTDTIFQAVDVLHSAGVVRRAPVVNDYDGLMDRVSSADIAVVAQDRIDAVLLEETHHALSDAHVPTGGKRIVKHMRRPTKDERIRSSPRPKR